MKIRKRLFILIMAIAIASAQWVPAFAASQENGDSYTTEIRKAVKAESAVVLDSKTGEILFGKDAYKKMEPASTTKIVTYLVAMEHLELDQVVRVKSDGIKMGNVIGVKRGEKFTVEQMMYALLVYSANDIAVAIAEEVAGSEEAFAKLMNEKAKQLGANSSNFQNPNGLNWAWHDQHYSTAYDMAIITKEAMKDKTFRKIVRTAEYTLPETNKSEERHLINSNKFLWDEELYEEVLGAVREKDPDAKLYMPDYSGVIGVKTGNTSTAGSCIVAVKDANGRELIGVVFKSKDDQRYKDLMAMWDYCLDEYFDTYTQMETGEEVAKIRVKRGEVRKVQAVTAEEVAATITKEEKRSKIKTEVVKKDLKAPVKKGDVVGKVQVYYDDKLINQKNLVAAETVKKGGFFSLFGIPDWMAPFICITVVLLALIIFIDYKLRERKRAKARRKREERRRQNV